jgi:BMFP domain-containing protein YqiC
MTTTSSRFFDELAKLATNAAGAAQGIRREIDTLVKAQVERVLNEVGVVKREDFDVVRDMAQKAREENDRLNERIAVLEARLGVTPPSATGQQNESTGETATH